MIMSRLCLPLALLAPLLQVSLAEYPVISTNEGFEVDMEPFWIETDYEKTNPFELDLEGFFQTEMQTALPNALGVVLTKYEDTTWESTEASRSLFTGAIIFQGPPFRTNHDVYSVQSMALSSLRAAGTYLQVHNASMGVPEWFVAPTFEGVDYAGDTLPMMPEETDATDVNLASSNGITLPGVCVGAAMGILIGAFFTVVIMRSRRCSLSNEVNGTGSSRRHKRKTSTVDLSRRNGSEKEIDYIIDCDSDSLAGDFCDEEAQKPFPKDARKDAVNISQQETAPRRASHHRRWKSSAFHDTPSPASVMDDLFHGDAPSSNHRRSNSMADAYKRRESMTELLALDSAEFMDNSERTFT